MGCTQICLLQEGGVSHGGGTSGHAAYESIRNFCLGRQHLSYVDLMSTFYYIDEHQLGKLLAGLAREGLLQVRLQLTAEKEFLGRHQCVG